MRLRERSIEVFPGHPSPQSAEPWPGRWAVTNAPLGLRCPRGDGDGQRVREIASVALSTERFDQLADVARDVGGASGPRGDRAAHHRRGHAVDRRQFGAFFYNMVGADGEAYTLYTILRRSTDRRSKISPCRATRTYSRRRSPAPGSCAARTSSRTPLREEWRRITGSEGTPAGGSAIWPCRSFVTGEVIG